MKQDVSAPLFARAMRSRLVPPRGGGDEGERNGVEAREERRRRKGRDKEREGVDIA